MLCCPGKTQADSSSSEREVQSLSAVHWQRPPDTSREPEPLSQPCPSSSPCSATQGSRVMARAPERLPTEPYSSCSARSAHLTFTTKTGLACFPSSQDKLQAALVDISDSSSCHSSRAEQTLLPEGRCSVENPTEPMHSWHDLLVGCTV